jgi:hypothetical protein
MLRKDMRHEYLPQIFILVIGKNYCLITVCVCVFKSFRTESLTKSNTKGYGGKTH